MFQVELYELEPKSNEILLNFYKNIDNNYNNKDNTDLDRYNLFLKIKNIKSNYLSQYYDYIKEDSKN